MSALLAAYALIGLPVAARVMTMRAWHVMYKRNRLIKSRKKKFKKPQSDMWVGGALVGLLCLPIWPLVAAGVSLAKRRFLLADGLFAPPPGVAEKRRLDGWSQTRQRSVAMERELGIGVDDD